MGQSVRSAHQSECAVLVYFLPYVQSCDKATHAWDIMYAQVVVCTQSLPCMLLLQELIPSIDDEDIERQVKERMQRHRLKSQKRLSKMKS